MSSLYQHHSWLAEACKGNMGARDLFPKIAATVTTYLTRFEAPEAGSDLPRPALLAGSQHGQVAALYTDREAARASLGDKAEHLQEEGALTTLALVFRAGLKGIVINPGTAEMLLSEPGLRLLFREYALLELARAGGAWVPTKDGSLLALQAMANVYTIPVYLRQADAEAYAGKTGGQPVLHPWSVIRDRALEVGSDGVYLQCGFPEEMGLPRPLVARLAGATEPDPLDLVESTIAEAQGTLTAEALWPKLRALDRIWILADKDGAPVSLDQVFDCFTSLPLADRFRVQHQVEGEPRFLKAEVFFKNIAAKGLTVGINRSLESAWTGKL